MDKRRDNIRTEKEAGMAGYWKVIVKRKELIIAFTLQMQPRLTINARGRRFHAARKKEFPLLKGNSHTSTKNRQNATSFMNVF